MASSLRRVAFTAAASTFLATQSAVAQVANTWAVVGESGVSAQQLFRGAGGKVGFFINDTSIIGTGKIGPGREGA